MIYKLYNRHYFNCFQVYDNITLEKQYKPPVEVSRAEGKPFNLYGVSYSPKYKQGELKRYEGRIKNLLIFLYPNKIYLLNSIHKYFKGNNFSDFHLLEMRDAILMLNEETGISWNDAIVKKCEYGCNIKANANKISNSLLSFKGKDYLPMQRNGKKYGVVCEFTDYKIKGYDKAFEVRAVEKINLIDPMFRWEISMARIRNIQKILALSEIKAKHLLLPETWQIMAEDAILKYKTTIKMSQLNLFKLSAHEKRIIAEMQVPQIREDLKHHNKATYKRDRAIYMRIMTDKNICMEDYVPGELSEKFNKLISGEPI